MRKFFVLMLLISSLSIAAKNDNFILRAYTTQGDTSAWVGLEFVAVMISHVNDADSVQFKLLSGHRDELMTDKDGEIRAMIQGGVGKYMLTLDREGYEPIVKEFERKYRDQTTVWLGTIPMQKERHKDLNEVEVVATAIKMVMNGDTIVYNANAFNLAEGSMLDALIRQLPNAQLNANGEITVNGRKISSLLINGKDFFKGDMNVAMKNLPSYTVKNIQVYDKASEDDYMTQASQKLSRKEDEENLVMDVVLKKEYSIGWMASAEGGYGTDDRWVGKLFGLGFTENLRLSAFGNFNNLMNSSKPSSEGNWESYDHSTGEGTIKKGGIDYLYDPDSKKVRASGSIIVGHEDNLLLFETASTVFFPTGDLYRRSSDSYRSRITDLKTDHFFHFKGENVYLSITPNFSWSHNESPSLSRTATFTEMPEETKRTEALDSVFARPFSKRYNDILLTRLRTAALSNTENLNASLNVNTTVRHKNLPGRFFIYAAGTYNHSTSKTNTIYNQTFGGANENPESPVNSNRFGIDGPETGKFSAGANYYRDWASIDEKRSQKISLTLSTNYHYTHVSRDYQIFFADRQPSDGTEPLPSMTRPEFAMIDARNSYNSTNNDHNIVSDAKIQIHLEPTARVDSGKNPAFFASLGFSHKYRSNSLDYNTLQPTHELVLRHDNLFTPNASVSYASENKIRYVNVTLRYRLNQSEPSINLFLHNRESSNPLIIYEYNAHNLRKSKAHNINLYLSRYGRSTNSHFSSFFSYNLTQDAIGNASIYNPETDVTIYKPMNINGNWNVNGCTYYSHTFGATKQITLSGDIYGNYAHSVDFHTTVGSPERSLVKNLNLSGNLGGAYKFKNGSTLSLDGSAEWQNSHGEREGFRKISAMNYHASMAAIVELPWEMQLRTKMTMTCSTGYDVAEMNEAQWLWNASLSKSIMKGNLTFKLSANDILGQQKPYRISVDSQGRYETWTNTLRRYAMLTVLYRFNKHPKKNNNK